LTSAKEAVLDLQVAIGTALVVRGREPTQLEVV
jgi:hypothetical protein